MGRRNKIVGVHMVINCPKCHLCYEYKTREIYTCPCGTKFTANEFGEVLLLSKNEAPPADISSQSCRVTDNKEYSVLTETSSNPIYGFSLQELKRLRNNSRNLIRCGWFKLIVISPFVFIPILLMVFMLSPNNSMCNIHSLLLLIITLALLVIPDFYIYTRCRTASAQIFVFTESFLGTLFFAWAIVNSLFNAVSQGGSIPFIVSYAIGYAFVPTIFFVFFIIILRAACNKILWGQNRVTHKQIEFAYEKRRNNIGFINEELPIPPPNHPICDTIFVILGWISALIFFTGAILGSLNMVATVKR